MRITIKINYVVEGCILDSDRSEEAIGFTNFFKKIIF